MNTLPPDNNQHIILSTIAGTIVCMLLVASLFLIVHIEEQSKALTLTASPSPKIIAPQESVTPLPSYTPHIPGMSTQEAFDLFKQNTFDKDIYSTEKRLVRWEQASIPWRLRGQFTPEDTVCMQSIAQQFNAAMEVAQLEEQNIQSGRRGIEIYLLPKDQFSSINPDIRPERAAQMFYTLSGHALSSINLLIDTNQSTDFRCFYIRTLMLQAVGLANPVLGNHLAGQPTSPSFLQYGRVDELDNEMLRILYSPLVTSGLTEAETERRIVQ